jgi:hypothetical protein
MNAQHRRNTNASVHWIAGRLVNVYSVGFIRTLATTCAPAHDRRGLLMKVGRLYLDKWSKHLGQVP